jgi:hypothetical protein
MNTDTHRWKRFTKPAVALLMATAALIAAMYWANALAHDENERSTGTMPSQRPAQESQLGVTEKLDAAKRAETGYAELCGDRPNRQCIRDEDLNLDDLGFLVQELRRTEDYRTRDDLSWLLIDLAHAIVADETPIEVLDALMYHISRQENWEKISAPQYYIHGEKLDKLTAIGVLPGEESKNLLLSLLEENEAATLAKLVTGGPDESIPFSVNFMEEVVGAAASGLAYKQDSEAYAKIVQKLGKVYVELRHKDWHRPNPAIGNEANREEFRNLYGMQLKLIVAISEFEAVKKYGADYFRKNYQHINTLQFDPCLTVDECEAFLEAHGVI